MGYNHPEGASEGSSAAGGKKERTRARLLELAEAVILEKGFQDASLAEIASRAGMTKGAIYSNFESRDDLIMAVVMRKNFNLNPVITPGMTRKEIVERTADAVMDLLERASGQGAFAAAFHLFAITHEPMRRRVAELQQQILSPVSAAELTGREEGRIPARLIPIVMQSLVVGLLYQSFLTPEFVTREAVTAAVDAILGPTD